MTVVIDASAAVAVALAMPGADVFQPLLEQADMVIAPELFIAEVCNAFWKYRKADLLTTDRCEQSLENALGLADHFESSLELHREAFAMAVRHLHPVYDALYLVIARRRNATLLTFDRRMAELARKLEIDVLIPG